MSCVQLGSCQSCGSNMYLNMHNLCVEDCGEGMYGSTSSGQCEKCHASCRTCKNGRVNNTCTSCHGEQNLDGNNCMDGCPPPKKLLPRSIRLVGGESSLYGRLEVLHRGVWGTVCDEGFNRKAGEVACKALGFGFHIPTVYANPPPASQRRGGNVPKSIWLQYLHCSGSESNLFQCKKLHHGRSYCTHNKDVWMKCQSVTQEVSQSRCVENCPAAFFTNVTQPKCEHCHYSCATCSGGAQRCTSCETGRFLFGSACSWRCRYGFFGNTSSGLCTQCSSNCTQCKDGTRDDKCTRCAYGEKLINNQCVDACPAGTAGYSGRCYVTCPRLTYRVGNQCRRCPRYCTACKTTRPTGRVDCSSCQAGYAFNGNGRCVHNCPSGFQKEYFINTTGLDVRLIGLVPNKGRLEVLYNGTWGSVCYDRWISRNTQTVCKRLGYVYGGGYPLGRQRLFPSNLSSTEDQPIWMSEVQCDRKHTSLGMCRHSGWGVNDCTHSQDVYLSCYGDVRQSRCVRSCSAGNYLKPWYRVCYRCLGQCAECLGTRSSCQRCNSGFYLFNQYCVTICPDGYFGDSGSGRCSRCSQSCAACKDTSSFCTACPPGHYLRGGRCLADCGNDFYPEKFSNARLVGGPSDSKGYVLIATGQKGFGYVCHDYWSLADGHVICRQLKLGHASKVYVWSYFKNVNASIPILLDNMLCKGNETSLLDCRHNGIGVHNCNYNKIAAVKCTKAIHPWSACHHVTPVQVFMLMAKLVPTAMCHARRVLVTGRHALPAGMDCTNFIQLVWRCVLKATSRIFFLEIVSLVITLAAHAADHFRQTAQTARKLQEKPSSWKAQLVWRHARVRMNMSTQFHRNGGTQFVCLEWMKCQTPPVVLRFSTRQQEVLEPSAMTSLTGERHRLFADSWVSVILSRSTNSTTLQGYTRPQTKT